MDEEDIGAADKIKWIDGAVAAFSTQKFPAKRRYQSARS